MASPRYLFVYGLLRSDVGGPMQPLLAQAARPAGRARWPGRLYHVAHYPGAVPAKDAAEQVVGELWELPDAAEELLARLDAYEGVPADYLRVQSKVYNDDGAVEAWIYLWNRPVEEERRILSGDFLEER